MRYYAYIVQGLVAEIINVDDDGPPLSARYPAEFVNDCVLLSDSQKNSVKPGWKYDGTGFYQAPAIVAPPPGPRYVPVATIRERMEEAGTWQAAANILQADVALMLKVLTLRDGVAADDPQARALIVASGSDPDEILAP